MTWQCKDKNILIIGLGVTGRAVADVLLTLGAKVTVFDTADNPELRLEAGRLRSRGAEVILGEKLLAPPAGCDMVIPSPGVKPTSELLSSAAVVGISVWSEIELAYNLFEPTILAVTGTNGKTTTTALAAAMLEASGVPAVACGNIGTALIEACAAAAADTVMVAEVSSFQLHFTEHFKPRVAVLLNISPDHADWHGDLRSYIADKAKVFARQGAGDYMVLNADEDHPAAGDAGVETVYFSLLSEVGGCYVLDGVIRDGRRGHSVICAADDLALPGNHNMQNALAAAAAVLCLGASPGGIKETMKTFPGVEHRLEFVADIAGVSYYNDSKATNPAAAIVALRSFDRPVILIAGGRNKGNDFNALLKEAAARARDIIVIGESGTELAGLAGAYHVTWHLANSLPEAVTKAASIARDGDIVLMSPACASYDMFSNFEDRGEVYKRAVATLGAGSK